MTELSEAAKAKANEMLPYNEHIEVKRERLARFIQQVSDATRYVDSQLAPRGYGPDSPMRERLAPFILPDPVDPLRAALREIPDEDIRMILSTYDVLAGRERIAQAITKNGLKIVEASHEQ